MIATSKTHSDPSGPPAESPRREPLASAGLPYKISTLLYCFDAVGRVLLIQRKREPNRGLWSPCGGKLRTAEGESPWDCARREAGEELGLFLAPADLHLTGIVSERGYQAAAHWLMFLFEVKRIISCAPPPIDEGRFEFFERESLARLAIPESDRDSLWPLFWRHRGGFFAAHCDTSSDGSCHWTVEQSMPQAANG